MNLRRPIPLTRATIEEHAPRLLRFFRSLGADPATAEDLVQEVFVRLVGTRAGYEERGSLGPYLLRVAHRIWIDETRVRRPFPAGASDAPILEPAPREEDNPFDALARAETAARVAAAVAELPVEQRTVFELAVGQRLPYRDVASVLGIPVGTVKSRMFAAASRLRRALLRGARS